jgi:hypothetical protein
MSSLNGQANNRVRSREEGSSPLDLIVNGTKLKIRDSHLVDVNSQSFRYLTIP